MNQRIFQSRSGAYSGQSALQIVTGLIKFVARSQHAAIVLAATCVLCTTSLHAQWTQVWGGNFPGAAGATYNHSQWWNDVQPTAVWGDGTIQNTSDSLSNVYLDGNGDLVIAMTYNPNNAVPYTSARLTSTYAAGPYGKIDARIQNPSALGMGAAFWALGADAYPAATGPGSSHPSTSGGVPWPWCGELDMMEIQAKTSNHNGSTIHGGETDSQTSYEYGGLSSAINLTGNATFDNGFHVFTTEWSPYTMTYLLDGVQYATYNLANIGATDQWEMNQPINFILSSGIGGNGGTPNGQGFPSNLVVNYVDYSQWAAGAPSPVTGLTAKATNSNAVSLSWNASSTSGVYYDIYASTTAGAAPSLATLVAQNVTTTSYVHTGLQPSTTYYYTVVSANFGGESSATNATVTTQAPGNSTGMQLSAGGYAVGTYMNSNFVLGGNTNYHYNVGPPSGLTAVNTSQVTNPAPQAVYNTERWGAAAWTITGLTPLAGYNVRLHFVEFAHTAAGQRNFNVSINSDQVLTNFDIFAAAGAADTAIAEEFYTTADENGIIELQTAPGTTSVADLNPTINAIEIIPATGSNPVGAAPGTTTDLAINSGGPAVGSFVADEDFNGGDVATNTNTITLGANSAPEAVYQDQRYVPFTYVLTGMIADASYTVKLHFAETYWTAAGQRIFNVVINGTPALTGLDVFKTAGGENVAYDPSLAAKADKYGQIIVQFIYGGADQPFINGIEAIQSGGASCGAIPSAPAGLSANASSSTAISLSWNAVTPPANCSINSYNVYRSTTSGFTPSSATLIGKGISGTSYSSTGLSAGTTYYYVVEALDADGSSGPSSQASATTQPTGGGSCSVAPSAPTGLAATAASSSSIGLSWTAVAPPTNCTITSYRVYGSTTSGFTPSSTTLLSNSVTSTSYTNTGLLASTTYYYVVEATNSDGTSVASSQASAKTSASSSPGSEIVAIASGGPAVSDSGGGDASFVADEDFSGGGGATSANTITTAGVANAAPEAVYQSERAGSFTYTIPGLTAGNQYTVLLHFAEFYWTAAGKRVFNVAINGTPVLSNFDIYATVGANKALVEQFTATANSTGQIDIAYTPGAADQPKSSGIEIRSTSGGSTCSTLPSAPAGLTAAATSSSSIGLTWTADTAPENCTITSYNVYGSATSGFTPSSSNLIATVTSPSDSITGLSASKTYYYVVEAVDADGNSAASTQVSATTQPAGDFIAINSGGPAVSNSGGGDAPFAADEDFSGGGTDTSVNTITTAGVVNAAPAAVYQSERAGAFTYTIPGLVAGSTHTVLLHFCEYYFTASGERVFNVAINGTPVLTNFDIYAAAGANKALVEQFSATANSSGQIVIAYTTGTKDQPKSSGIEIR
ncbi:Endo-1,4-beta-xylanase A precursor [Acidisarcina polymorpha]|uniref:Endo-1,4-beta-xylanase A n=1 Tax=Acidisarcina polymorpha TaxID=2211140 RepID=A0A2Z5G0L4_9BACT|nr:malectin domain-containing carbohydrate-binding protein [Acidisarcina polymorpha]AXC12579.1 Endo-1,4-beta-xylanase A precursor [Acidisarcina polymorpha]